VRVGPRAFASVPCPTYPEIDLAITTGRAVAHSLDAWAGDADVDLRLACLSVLEIPRAQAPRHGERFSWRAAGLQSASYLAPIAGVAERDAAPAAEGLAAAAAVSRSGR
jgi:hypothetical protein